MLRMAKVSAVHFPAATQLLGVEVVQVRVSLAWRSQLLLLWTLVRRLLRCRSRRTRILLVSTGSLALSCRRGVQTGTHLLLRLESRIPACLRRLLCQAS